MILLQEGRYAYDAGHRQSSCNRYVVRLLTAEGAAGWGDVTASWTPSHNKRPVVRARVIAPDGTVTDLNPQSLIERQLPAEDGVYGDRHVMEGPLPSLPIGALLESEVCHGDSKPFFPAGVAGLWHVGSSERVLRWRFRFDAPTSLHARVEALGPQNTPLKHQVFQGRDEWRLEGGEIKWDLEGYVPPSQRQIPAFAYSTAQTWKAVAAAYSASLPIDPLPPELKKVAEDHVTRFPERRDRAEALLAWVQAHVRYTGIQIGPHNLTPVSSATTISRGFGDCKDQSFLLAQLLEASGIRARLALLDSGDWLDIPADHPGMGLFDHAIVVAEGPDPLWMDPTDAHAPATVLRADLSGRLALIIDKGTSGLVTTPTSDPAQHGWTERREIWLSADGPSRWQEVTEYYGHADQKIKAGYRDRTPEETQETLTTYAKTAWGESEQLKISVTDARSRTTPFQIGIFGVGTFLTAIEGLEFEVGIDASGLVSDLNKLWLPNEKETQPRRHSVWQDRNETLRRETLVHLPSGVEVLTPPRGSSWTLGPFQFSEEYKQIDATTWLGTAQLVLTAGEVGIEDFEKATEFLRALHDDGMRVATFEHASARFLHEGRFVEAMAQHHADRVADPQDPHPHLRASTLLLDLNLGEAAVLAAKRAVELDPDFAEGWRTLGWAQEHGRLGIRWGPGWDRSAAFASYEHALALNPNEIVALTSIALLHEFGPDGFRYGPKSDLAAAVATLEKIPEDQRTESSDKLGLIDLFYLRRPEEVLERCGAGPPEAMAGVHVAATVLVSGVRDALLVLGRWGYSDTDRKAVGQAVYNFLLAIGEFHLAQDWIERGAIFEPQRTRELAEILAKARSAPSLRPELKRPADAALQASLIAFDGSPLLVGSRALWKSPHTGGDESLVKFIQTLMADLLPSSDKYAGQLDGYYAVFAGISVPTEQAYGRRVAIVLATKAGPGAEALGSTLVVRQDQDWQTLTTGPNLTRLAEATTAWVKEGSNEDTNHLVTAYLSAFPATPQWIHDLWWNFAAKDPSHLKPFVGLLGCLAQSDLPCSEDILGSDFELTEKQRIAAMGVHAEWNSARGNHPRAVDLAEALFALQPNNAEAFRGLIQLYGTVLDFESMKKHAKACQTFDAKWVGLECALIQAGNWQDYTRALDDVPKSDRDAHWFNQRAWHALIEQKDLDKAVAWAQEAARLVSGKNAATLHTLAAAQATAGDVADARDSLAEIVVLTGGNPDFDGYVHGRMAEALGEFEAAKLAYERTLRTPRGGSYYSSVQSLAAAGLERLNHSPDKAPEPGK